jgi:hypothetical protein
MDDRAREHSRPNATKSRTWRESRRITAAYLPLQRQMTSENDVALRHACFLERLREAEVNRSVKKP